MIPQEQPQEKGSQFSVSGEPKMRGSRPTTVLAAYGPILAAPPSPTFTFRLCSLLPREQCPPGYKRHAHDRPVWFVFCSVLSLCLLWQSLALWALASLSLTSIAQTSFKFMVILIPQPLQISLRTWVLRRPYCMDKYFNKSHSVYV